MSDLDLTEAVEAAARAQWEDWRNQVVGNGSPLEFGTSWETLSEGIRHETREAVLPAIAAAAPLIEAQVREQIAAEAVAYDHDDAHRLLRDFAGGCGDNACLICCGAA